MPGTDGSAINGLYFRLVFFDYIYMLGEFLAALSELHVKVQLVDRYCNKVLHNLRLMEKRDSGADRIRDFIRTENRELVTGLERQNIFYDKYRLKLIRIAHRDTAGELAVEDTYNGSQFVVPVKRILDTLLSHTYDSTSIQEMDLFPQEQKVVHLTSALDEKPGETARKTLLELQQAARNVHIYVKKEKLAGVDYLAEGKPVSDAGLIELAESQPSDKDRFLQEPRIRDLFPRVEASVS